MARPHQIVKPLLLLLAFAFWPRPARRPATRDVAGSRDYPGIGRFAGSVITGYQVKDFDAARLQAAPFKDGKPTDERRLEGRSPASPIAPIPAPRSSKSRAISRPSSPRPDSRRCSPATPTPAAAFPSPKRSTRCRSRRCGSTASTIATTPAARARAGARPMPASWSARTTTTSMRSSWSPRLGAIENKMVDAAAMAKGLRENGHIALYGIYFDTDKAVIKPESRPTLDQIAKLLRAPAAAQRLHRRPHRQPGHVDYNMDLSRRRAEAVAAELAKSYRIGAPRLSTAGVGFLAPVGSNAIDAGRALNRRVELVAP